MSESAIRALVTRWQEGVTSLHAANEDEAVTETRTLREIRAAEIERCLAELREALAAPHPIEETKTDER